MKVDDMEAFVEVVRSQSLSHAADALGLTQPAVTRRLQHLEETLGVALLDRQSKPLRPTPAGRAIFEQCCTIVREVGTLRGMLDDAAPLHGNLRLGVAQTVADIAMLDALLALKDAHPALQVRVASAWGSLLMQRVEEGELDAVAVALPAHRTFPAKLVGRPLGALKLAIVARKGTTEKRTYTLAECQAYGWVLNPDGCGFRAALQHALASHGHALRLNLETLGTELQLGLVANGLGLGIVPVPLLNVSGHADALDIIQISDFRPEIDIWMVHARQIGRFAPALDLLSARIAAAFEAASLARAA
ncbi:MAG: LysR family transcriptional regulator [Burkholderia gladioli]